LKGFWKSVTIRRSFIALKLSAQRHETEPKQFQNCFKTVSKLFCFSFISLCGQFDERDDLYGRIGRTKLRHKIYPCQIMWWWRCRHSSLTDSEKRSEGDCPNKLNRRKERNENTLFWSSDSEKFALCMAIFTWRMRES